MGLDVLFKFVIVFSDVIRIQQGSFPMERDSVKNISDKFLNVKGKISKAACTEKKLMKKQIQSSKKKFLRNTESTDWHTDKIKAWSCLKLYNNFPLW